jgi:hypothetical protein
VRTLYVVPTATLAGTKPRGTWHATPAPGAPQWSLCVVEFWNDEQADDDWEALPGVQPLHIETWGQVVPALAVTAFGPWGVVATDTIRQAMRKVKAIWAQAHP